MRALNNYKEDVMEDEKIIALYWQRDQSAIDETDRKYGVQLRGLSYGILSDREDAEECVSDTYMEQPSPAAAEAAARLRRGDSAQPEPSARARQIFQKARRR